MYIFNTLRSHIRHSLTMVLILALSYIDNGKKRHSYTRSFQDDPDGVLKICTVAHGSEWM